MGRDVADPEPMLRLKEVESRVDPEKVISGLYWKSEASKTAQPAPDQSLNAEGDLGMYDITAEARFKPQVGVIDFADSLQTDSAQGSLRCDAATIAILHLAAR